MSNDHDSSSTNLGDRFRHNWDHFWTSLVKRVKDPSGRKEEVRRLSRRIDMDALKIKELETDIADANRRLVESQNFLNELSTELMIQELAANTDELTGAHNRKSFNYFLENVGKEVADRGFTGKGCVVAIDLDRFKQVNDTFGHAAGDEVLKAVVQRLQKVNLVSAETKVYRLGGDEFVLIVLDKRRDHDRRTDNVDDLDLTASRDRGPDRRQMSFEVYVRNAIGEAIAEAASKSVRVKLSNGKEVDVDFGISEGIGHFDSVTRDAMVHALREADSEAYVRKSGLDDFMAHYEDLDDKTKAFVDNVLGFRYDEDARGGFVIDREIGFTALAEMEEFQSFMSGMNDRTVRWVFPEFHQLMTQSTPEPGR